MSKGAQHPAMKYAHDVVAGKIAACKSVRAACERHLRDLETGHERGLEFDPDAAQHAIDFFGWLKHSKGEWAGRTIELEPWQQFIIWCVFGWMREDGTRRFRTAYQEVARKNGKSTMLAGVGLYMLLADHEAGAEVYTAATKRDQARITHSEATRMVKASPALRKRLRVFKDNIHIPETASKFEPLGKDADSLDGLNVHCAVIDEVHAHKSRDMVDILDTATGSRRQPLIFMITTAGFDRNSVCWEQHEYTDKVLSGVVEDDSFFGIVYGLDESDDWEDERNWIKANPNLGVSKKIDDMRRKAKKAKEMPTALNAFLRLELNVWTQAETKWISLAHWQACGAPADDNGLRGRVCYAGLDLSSTLDISAFVMVFPPETDEDNYSVLCRFFIPEAAMRERSKRDRVPYDVWVRQGFITATPGEVIDYDYIEDQIKEDAERYDLREIAFDRWNASQLINNLVNHGIAVLDTKDGAPVMIQHGMGYSSMNAPMKDLEKMIVQHRIAHGNNPVLTWMGNNLVASQDPAGNIKPDKEKSTERIDGMVALIMALGRALVNGDASSVYDDRGVLTL
jgi:phage terminase large subunit-like protein